MDYKKTKAMATSEDFSELWLKYQKEGRPKGVSIVNYCRMNGVVYGQFEKWYRRCVSDVKIVNLDAAVRKESPSPDTLRQESEIMMSVRIEFQDGLTLEHHGLDMAGLKTMVSKVEALCSR